MRRNSLVLVVIAVGALLLWKPLMSAFSKRTSNSALDQAADNTGFAPSGSWSDLGTGISNLILGIAGLFKKRPEGTGNNDAADLGGDDNVGWA